MSGGVPRALRLELGAQRICPACKGRGTIPGSVNGKRVDVECRRCKGAGLVDAGTGRALAGDELPF